MLDKNICIKIKNTVVNQDSSNHGNDNFDEPIEASNESLKKSSKNIPYESKLTNAKR